jgi:hypothetical protein
METAATHHFGLVAPVNPKSPRSIRIKYAARPLLGKPAQDVAIVLATALAWVESKGFK